MIVQGRLSLISKTKRFFFEDTDEMIEEKKVGRTEVIEKWSPEKL